MSWYYRALIIGLAVFVVNCAVVPDNVDVFEQGLYKRSDGVTILMDKIFDRKVYGQKHAILLQFYNSYCGHCRAFAPKFKNLASDLVPWKNIIKLAVIDCSVEENNEICRQFEIMAYPTLRYFHENYIKNNANVGDRIQTLESVEKLKDNLISKMQSEQAKGRLTFAPPLNIVPHATYLTVLSEIPKNIVYTFLVFENENSTVGSELALDLSDYRNILVKRVYDNSELAEVAGIKGSPGLVAVKTSQDTLLLSPSSKNPTKKEFLKAINTYLKSKNYVFPVENVDTEDSYSIPFNENPIAYSDTDVVYYSDLEKTIKTSLHTEITRHKTLSNEPLQALLDYLDVLITAFPFKQLNLKEYIVTLRNSLNGKNQWSGNEVYDLVKSLETVHAPLYSSNLDYIGCKGSETKYRGYTCGLWTLFHTLTVNTVDKPGTEGPKVLKAMYGYVKYFFGCTDCSEHFQAMATRNRMYDVKENDKAVIWLWISHNEVNLRLAGDVTEDPQHPKIQFPSINKCSECRLSRGAWNLPAVYEYLLKIYGAKNIQSMRATRSANAETSPFSNLDIGMLSLLYILSFIFLILVIKYFISKSFFRKRRYKHAWGKV